MKDFLFPVVILAGGLATRLRPMTETIPKSLVTIQDEPFIYHQLRLLQKNGIREVVLCVGYLGEMIEAEVGRGEKFNMHIEYVYDGATLLGTAGAIKRALPLLRDEFFILYGDSYLTCDYLSIQKAFLKSGKLALMTVFHNQGQWDKSNIEFESGKILAYDKTMLNDNMHYIDYGLGVMKKSAFEQLPQASDLALLYQHLLKKDELAAFLITERFYEVGSFAGIKELEYHLAHLKRTFHEVY